jgi:hypothetical protein
MPFEKLGQISRFVAIGSGVAAEDVAHGIVRHRLVDPCCRRRRLNQETRTRGKDSTQRDLSA